MPKEVMIPTPNFYEKSSFLNKRVDVFSELLSDRIIMLFNEINNDAACVIISQLLYLEAADSNKDIYLYINSRGGDVQAGLAIFDTIRHLKCDVCTICVGTAASMGAFLLAAGTKGKRYSLEHSSILIHQALGAIPFSQTSDIEIHANRMSNMKKMLNGLLANMCNKTEKEIEKDTDRDYYLTPKEAVKYGIIDEVIIDE